MKNISKNNFHQMCKQRRCRCKHPSHLTRIQRRCQKSIQLHHKKWCSTYLCNNQEQKGSNQTLYLQHGNSNPILQQS